MAGVQCTDLPSRPTAFLAFTSVPVDEFQDPVLPFETTFHANRAAWRRDGTPRTAPRLTVSQNCPLADTGRSALLPPDFPQDLPPPRRPGRPVHSNVQRVEAPRTPTGASSCGRACRPNHMHRTGALRTPLSCVRPTSKTGREPSVHVCLRREDQQ